MARRDHEPVGWDPLVKIPADVEKEDQILAGLTARQTVQLAAVVLVLWLGWHATAGLVPPLAYLAVAALVLAAAIAVVLTQRDGVNVDRWLHSAWQHHRSPHHYTPADPEPGQDDWPPEFTDPGTPTRLPLPVAALERDGTLLLADGSAAVLSESATVNFALRTPAEQQVLVAGFGRWLNSLTAPVQLLVHSQWLDLAPVTADLERQALELPHPLLEDAAWEHAGFLAELAADRDLLARQVLIVHRETGGDRAAGLRARRRAEETSSLLAGAAVAVQQADGPAAWRALVSACDPGAPAHPDPALPDAAVTGPTAGGSA